MLQMLRVCWIAFLIMLVGARVSYPGAVHAQLAQVTATPPALPTRAATTAATLAATSNASIPIDTTVDNITIHVVQPGETLYLIAQQFGTTTENLAQVNNIRDVTLIKVGQRLLIPDAVPSGTGTASDYIMQPDDSLITLSARYGMSIDSIAQRNDIVNPAQVYVGLRLALQDGANGVKSGWLYTVQRDDNVYRIAARLGIPIFKLREANHLTATATLYSGQKLVIPQNNLPLVDVPAPFAQIKMLPAQAEQGRTVQLSITTATPVTLSGNFVGKPLIIHSDDPHIHHLILIGIDSLTPPGIYPLELSAIDGQKQTINFSRNVAVMDGGYTSEAIQLAPELSDLINPKITQPENDKVEAIVGTVTPKRYSVGIMGIPCPAPIISQFGTRRSYNGGPYDQVHAGTDFAAAPGSPIFASAAGVVVFAGPLTVRGNATIIDHGWGVYTGYWHQSEIDVKVGAVVQQGQIIGLVGDTGRVTGPHLHWELFVNGVQVDGLQWVRLNFS